MSRIREIPPENMSPEQAEAYQALRASGALVGGPNIAYLRIPRFLPTNQAVVGYIRSSSLPPRLRQIVILRTVKFWGAKFAWGHHVPNSLKEGVEQEIIDAIDAGREPASASPRDRAALRVCAELLETRRLGDDAYRAAIELFGENGLADIVVTIGFYSMTSLTLNTFDIDPPRA